MAALPRIAWAARIAACWRPKPNAQRRTHAPQLGCAKGRAHPRPRGARGFTLIEVMVALAVLALALAALSQGSSALIRLNERQALLTAAQLCADNALVQARLGRTLPAVGDSTLDCTQGPLRLQVLVQVRTTPNPSFRRVDAEVRDGFGPLLRASTVVGRT